MRIGVDYTAAVRQGGGIGRYTRELMRAVVARMPPALDLRFLAAAAGMGERWREAQARLRAEAPDADRLRFRTLPLTDDWMARLW